MKRILFLATIALITLMGYFVWQPLCYEGHYFEKVGLTGDWRYTSIIKEKGLPKLEEIKDGFCVVYYDGLELFFNEDKAGIVNAVKVVGEDYHFGLWRIGVGSTRKDIERVYGNVRKIKDLADGEFGVIEGNTWVWFKFDANSKVSTITLTNGL